MRGIISRQTHEKLSKALDYSPYLSMTEFLQALDLVCQEEPNPALLLNERQVKLLATLVRKGNMGDLPCAALHEHFYFRGERNYPRADFDKDVRSLVELKLIFLNAGNDYPVVIFSAACLVPLQQQSELSHLSLPPSSSSLMEPWPTEAPILNALEWADLINLDLSRPRAPTPFDFSTTEQQLTTAAEEATEQLSLPPKKEAKQGSYAKILTTLAALTAENKKLRHVVMEVKAEQAQMTQQLTELNETLSVMNACPGAGIFGQRILQSPLALSSEFSDDTLTLLSTAQARGPSPFS